jgi:hypothetical protein
MKKNKTYKEHDASRMIREAREQWLIINGLERADDTAKWLRRHPVYMDWERAKKVSLVVEVSAIAAAALAVLVFLMW